MKDRKFMLIVIWMMATTVGQALGQQTIRFINDSLTYEISIDSLSHLILSNDGNAHCWSYPGMKYSILIDIRDKNSSIDEVSFAFAFDENSLRLFNCSLKLKELGEFWISEKDELKQLADLVSPVLYSALDECLDPNFTPQDDEWEPSD